jgi:transaldolase/glucose-6-phosphate isomerase
MTERRKVKKEGRDRGRAVPHDSYQAHLGSFQSLVEERGKIWERGQFARRLWAKDPTLWSSEPAAELSDRLGWLDLPEKMREQEDRLLEFADEVKARGMERVVLLGMGGSSLAPEVFQRLAGRLRGYPDLIVLDSTHPASVRAVEATIDLRRTLFLVSSKSGTTTETLSFFRYFWRRVGEIERRPGDHFVAITDPGTPLEQLSRELNFRSLFQAPPDVGGRYSALSVFGLLPAALIGLNIRELLDRAQKMAEMCAAPLSDSGNPGLFLGGALGELALAGRDKVTFLATPSMAGFPIWVEQLIAESTGKEGKGIIPVVDEPAGSPEVYGADRFFVYLRTRRKGDDELEARLLALKEAGHPVVLIEFRDALDLGREYFRWEVAVAAAGAILKVHPFDQPDVEWAKELARRAMEGEEKDNGEEAVEQGTFSAADPEPLSHALGNWLATARAGDYVGLQAFLAPAPGTTAALQKLRLALRDRRRLATTFGYGPRFLHSTGQLHKGGPDSGLFLQLVDDPPEDLPVPETGYTFGALIRAQAMGDWQALRQRGRRVLRINLGRNVAEGLQRLLEAIGSSC